jgi:hypothetical protein
LHYNNSAAANELFASLLSFEFVAIFPFYNHVDEVLKCVRKMTRLLRLFIRLCPDVDSVAFRDEVELAGGALDVHDLWNESDTSWTLIAHTVRFLSVEGQLEELHMDDMRIAGVSDTIKLSLINALYPDGWQYQQHGVGVWRRFREAIGQDDLI